VSVFINEKDTIAWIYWYNQDVTGKPVIASGSVLEYKESGHKNQSGFYDPSGSDY
jgi:gamma-glutamylcyclotransferase (GGCT)/AIG2-like uncharacterized protein YtfP